MSAKARFDVPSGAVARVSIIDTTLRISGIPTNFLILPPVPGFEQLPTIPSWSFLIESSNGKKALFDLGVPRDRAKAFSPATNKQIEESGWPVEVEKDVVDILADNGVDPKEIDSIIWSHFHWDHNGDPSLFPRSTELVVGPGFKDAFLPAYPTNPESPLMESHWKDRNLREITFEDQNSSPKAGNLRAVDFFGDGSFYLLDTPGHAIGHLGGLARTSSNPDTFIFMGGDLCHHGCVIRPSRYLPYPSTIPMSKSDLLRVKLSVCPGADMFENFHTKHSKSPNEPVFYPAIAPDFNASMQTIKDTQEADAQDNVFFVFAHDTTLHGVVDLFPRPANDWKEKGWKQATLWAFLKDLVPATQVQ